MFDTSRAHPYPSLWGKGRLFFLYPLTEAVSARGVAAEAAGIKVPKARNSPPSNVWNGIAAVLVMTSLVSRCPSRAKAVHAATLARADLIGASQLLLNSD